MEINQLEKIIASANGAIAARRHLAELKERGVSATIPEGSARNSEALAEAHESDLLQAINERLTVSEDVQQALQQVTNDQLKRLLKDAERLNFWQAHDWYTGERTAEGVWRFFHTEDADGSPVAEQACVRLLMSLRRFSQICVVQWTTRTLGKVEQYHHQFTENA